MRISVPAPKQSLADFVCEWIRTTAANTGADLASLPQPTNRRQAREIVGGRYRGRGARTRARTRASKRQNGLS